MGDNNLLLALGIVERIVPQVKDSQRDQLSRSTLNSIKQALDQATSLLSSITLNNDMILFGLCGITEFLDVLLSNDALVETDTESKAMIAERLHTVLSDLYLEAGKYYTTHEFSYGMKMDTLLNRVIDKCLEQGYYFGKEI